MTWGNWWWPSWLTLLSVLFLVPELIALFTNINDTLSDYCWRQLDVSTPLEFSIHSVAWYTSFATWLMFVVVITVHIWFRSI